MKNRLPKPDWQTPDGAAVLYCGDCLDIMPKLAAGSVDAVVTDPPYGHNNNDGDLIHKREAALGKKQSCEPRPILNDGPEANDIYRRFLPESHRLLKAGCCCCCCGGGPDPQFARWSLWMDEVFAFKQMVVWDKGPMGMGWHYRRSYETVLVGEKPGAACRWFGGKNKENIIRPGAYGIKKIIPSKNDHPCAKPVELYAHFTSLHSFIGDTILDPFMGAGPCGVACLRLGRRFIGIEKERSFFDMAVRRLSAEYAQGKLFALNSEGAKHATTKEHEGQTEVSSPS